MNDHVPQTRGQRLRHTLVKYSPTFALGALLLIATNLLALAIPERMGEAFNLLDTQGTTRDEVVRVVTIMIGLALAAACTRIGSRILIFNAGRKIEYDLRREVFGHLTRLDAGFFQTVTTGDLTSRISNDVNYVRLMFGVGILNLVNTTVLYTLTISKMWAINPTLMLWCLAPYPLVFVIIWYLVKQMYVYTQRSQTELSAISSDVQEHIAGVSVVKAFSAENASAERFAQSNLAYMEANLALARARGWLMPIVMGLGGLGTLIVLFVGGREVIAGHMVLGDFVAFNAYVFMLAWPTAAFGWMLGVWQRGLAGLDRLMTILQHVPAIQSPNNPEHGDGSGALSFDNVSLELGGRAVLKDVSFKIAPGEQVALVGWTGSGKSSLLNLIVRIYDASAGTIRVNGMPVTAQDLGELRRKVGYVMQDPFLFSTTVRRNMTYGMDGAAAMGEPANDDENEALAWAIDVAGLQDDVGVFTEGLETMVGERGITVSGGQKQRLTIARALLAKPSILLLDDALSSVDARTEQRIFDALTARGERSTVLLTTHRFGGLDRMDRILVLRDGMLVETGTHSELLSAGGHYAQMWARQQREAALEAA